MKLESTQWLSDCNNRTSDSDCSRRQPSTIQVDSFKTMTISNSTFQDNSSNTSITIWLPPLPPAAAAAGKCWPCCWVWMHPSLNSRRVFARQFGLTVCVPGIHDARDDDDYDDDGDDNDGKGGDWLTSTGSVAIIIARNQNGDQSK